MAISGKMTRSAFFSRPFSSKERIFLLFPSISPITGLSWAIKILMSIIGSMAQGTLKIHTENILPIIKKWLYSDKDIFLRELVSNACDALNKVKILQDQGQATAAECTISIRIDKANKTLV